jgi:light-regulated signal transduction histidine kinase (bacteriophytochrome)
MHELVLTRQRINKLEALENKMMLDEKTVRRNEDGACRLAEENATMAEIGRIISSSPPAYGNWSMIRQVFINLLSNAIKFTKPRKMRIIEIGCMTGEEQNTYHVRDNGAGFEMQHANKLFGVFQRLHSSDEFKGTGLGLAIVRRIIHRHGGQVWAEGKINEGATFYFTLPKGEKPQMN